MFIIVKESDIVDGIPDNQASCPIARAIRRRTGADFVHVSETTYTIDGKVKPLSRRGRNFVDRFDSGQSVRPGLYWV